MSTPDTLVRSTCAEVQAWRRAMRGLGVTGLGGMDEALWYRQESIRTLSEMFSRMALVFKVPADCFKEARSSASLSLRGYDDRMDAHIYALRSIFP